MYTKMRQNDAPKIVLAAVAALVGVGAKLALTTGQLLPGIDGAYYWVQVRSVLQDFTLAFDDLPLVFWVQSLIALGVGNIELGVRLSDAVLPTLSAIPIFLMLRKSKHVWVPALGILAALLHPIQLFFFTGDFIKNEAAIPVIFFIGWTLYNWGNSSKIRSSIYVMASLLVLALTHFGTLLMGLMIVALWGLFQLRNRSRRFWLISGLATLISSGLVLTSLAILVPARFTRLVEFVSQPETIFENPAWQMLFYGGNFSSILFAMITGQVGSICLGILLWRNRKSITGSAVSLAASTLIVSIMLSSPLIGFEWASRLAALSFAPLLIATFTLWMVCETKAAKIATAAIAISSIVAALALSPLGAKQSGITDAEYSNLSKAAGEFEFPANSIAVARHGLEYLVAWTMRTHVLQEESYADEDLSAYDAVYLLSSDGRPTINKSEKSSETGPKPPIDKKGLTPPKSDGKKSEGAGTVVYQNEVITITKLR